MISIPFLSVSEIWNVMSVTACVLLAQAVGSNPARSRS